MLQVLMSAAELKSDFASFVLLDVRMGPDRRARYEASHLEGAHFIDMDRDLAEPGDPAAGGRHPLPKLETFTAMLGSLGITPASKIVVCDDRPGAGPRLFWMLRALGHAHVRFLDGGLKGAIAAGVPFESGPAPERTTGVPYPATLYGLPTASVEEVDVARADPSWVVLDARSGVRFRGETEPFDPVAGHIPGAKSAPFEDGLEDGKLLNASALRARFDALLGDVPTSRVIVQCGSGVTACHLLLQMELAGLPGARLYVGSWSEWCRQLHRPIARGT